MHIYIWCKSGCVSVYCATDSFHLAIFEITKTKMLNISQYLYNISLNTIHQPCSANPLTKLVCKMHINCNCKIMRHVLNSRHANIYRVIWNLKRIKTYFKYSYVFIHYCFHEWLALHENVCMHTYNFLAQEVTMSLITV